MTPTSRSMQLLRRAGYLVDRCEQWNAFSQTRKDLLGVGDLLALTVGEPPLLVQSTTVSNVSARIAKCRESQALALWLGTGCRFVVHGWSLVNGRWHCKIVELSGADMAADVLSRPPRRGRKTESGDLFTPRLHEPPTDDPRPAA